MTMLDRPDVTDLAEMFNRLDEVLDTHLMVANNLARRLDQAGYQAGTDPLPYEDRRPI